MAGFYTNPDPTVLPDYMKRATQTTRTKQTTTPTVTPGNYQDYYQSAYGGVPMSVDTDKLSQVFNENVMAPGLEAGRRAAARRTGASGFAPNAGAEAEAARRLRGQYGTNLTDLIAQAMSSNVQNTLQARGHIAGGMLGGGTQTSETTTELPYTGGALVQQKQPGGGSDTWNAPPGAFYGGSWYGLDPYSDKGKQQREEQDIYNLTRPQPMYENRPAPRTPQQSYGSPSVPSYRGGYD